MRALPTAMLLAAGFHLAVLTAPSLAYAQGPQPIPYPTAPPPVPYGQPAATPTPSPAPAPPGVARTTAGAGSDAIYMKNGGILRGTIVDAIPGAQARIQLVTGEIATVPWPDISRVEHGEAPRPSAAPPAQAPSAPPARPAAGQLVWVHLDAPDEARLQEDMNGDGNWQTVCSAPCDIQLPNDKDYRITGGGLRSSKVFGLHGQAGDRETVTVNAGSKAWFVMGIVLVPVGGITMFIGLIVGLIGSALEAAGGQGAAGLAAGGWTACALGAAGVVGGIVLIVSNAKTSVSQDLAATQTGLLLQSDAWKRVPTPTWKEASPLDRAVSSPGFSVPVLSGRF